MWIKVNGVILMSEISRPDDENEKTQNMFGLEAKRYEELSEETQEIMKEYSREADFSELKQRLIDITENQNERDCVMWLLGLFYNLTGEYRRQMKERMKQR